MKNKWKNYSLKDGKVKDTYIREYVNKKKKKPEVRSEPMEYQREIDPLILQDAWVINLNANNAKEEEMKLEKKEVKAKKK